MSLLYQSCRYNRGRYSRSLLYTPHSQPLIPDGHHHQCCTFTTKQGSLLVLFLDVYGITQPGDQTRDPSFKKDATEANFPKNTSLFYLLSLIQISFEQISRNVNFTHLLYDGDIFIKFFQFYI